MPPTKAFLGDLFFVDPSGDLMHLYFSFPLLSLPSTCGVPTFRILKAPLLRTLRCSAKALRVSPPKIYEPLVCLASDSACPSFATPTERACKCTSSTSTFLFPFPSATQMFSPTVGGAKDPCSRLEYSSQKQRSTRSTSYFILFRCLSPELSLSLSFLYERLLCMATVDYL